MGFCISKPYPSLEEASKLEPRGIYKARLVKVYDGDTQTYVIKFQNKFYKIQVRLSGINTPEVNKSDPNYDAGIRARNRAFELLTSKPCEPNATLQDLTKYLNNNKVYATLNCLKSEKYGRVLAEVTTSTNLNLAEKLIQEKHGVRYMC
jgi:endonuclease YncB( thermonuclease family)